MNLLNTKLIWKPIHLKPMCRLETKKTDIVCVGKETIGVHFNVNIFKDVIMKICIVQMLFYVFITVCDKNSCSVLFCSAG